jgi:hypothetical protein
MPGDDERVGSDRPAASGCRVAKLITIQRRLIAAGDNPRPFTALDTVIRKETPGCLVGGSANDEVRRTGHDFVITTGAHDFERQRIIVRPSAAADQRPGSELGCRCLCCKCLCCKCLCCKSIAVKSPLTIYTVIYQHARNCESRPLKHRSSGLRGARVWPRRI